MADPQETETHAHGAAGQRDSLARTGPLLVLLAGMLLVYGLAVLSGATTSTGTLIVALVLLVVVTYGVVMGTVKLIDLPPDEIDEDQGHSSSHAH